jgi:MoaA/NifB/PqqE/SkfB family radical SAM enzyme
MSVLGDLARLRERPRVYLRIIASTISTGSLLGTLKSRFPFRLPDPDFPRVVALEFTNFCNLRCPYCAAQTGPVRGQRGFMTDATFSRIVSQLREFPLRTLRVIGGGEPTAHPRFADFASQLRGVARISTLTTNGQLFSAKNVFQTVTSFDIVEISVDGKDAGEYEKYRVGGSFQKLLRGIELLRSAAAQERSKMLLHIRIMLRVSDVERVPELRRYWEQYADSVSVQHLFDRTGNATNLFTILPNVEASFRQCEYPFKGMGICWNGDLPLCGAIEERLKVSDGGLLLGNINNDSLLEIWHGPLLRQYRKAHRACQPSGAPLCVGCNDVWGQTHAGGGRT